MVEVPVQAVVAEGDDGGWGVRRMNSNELGVELRYVRPSQLAVGMIQQDHLRDPERRRRRAQLRGAHAAERVVPRRRRFEPRSPWDAHITTTRMPLVGEPRQRPAAGERLIVGMGEHREHGPAFEGRHITGAVSR